jgi:hypothetical protein
MRRVAIGMLAAVISTGCAGCGASKAKPVTEPSPPDTSKIVKVVGRWTIASACPVALRHALTAAHVIDPRPFDQYPGYVPLVWQQGGRGGVFNVYQKQTFAMNGGQPSIESRPDVSMMRDIATLQTESDLDFYPIATVPPEPGDTLYMTGYDWRSKRGAFADRVWVVKLLRIVAGHLIFDPAGEPGTSGSCILNGAGEVVGINIAGKVVGSPMGRLSFVGEPEQVGIGVGIVKDKE